MSLEKLLKDELKPDVDSDPKELRKAAKILRGDANKGLMESAKTCSTESGTCDAKAISEALHSADKKFHRAEELEKEASKLEEVRAVERSICGAELRVKEDEFDYEIGLKDSECPIESLESIYRELEDRPHAKRNLGKRLIPANAEQEDIIEMMKDSSEK